ncbi:MAG: hypothetical protein CMJ49_08300 [Planctomycetaceae bacterium]|nr:hypothetical protein [Planctomycetaceae bacterium]
MNATAENDLTTDPPADALPTPSVRRDRVLWLILLVALAIRLFMVLTNTYQWDEERDWIPLAIEVSDKLAQGDVLIRGQYHPALPAYFIRLGSFLGGENPLGFRLSSLVIALLTVIIVYRAAGEWLGRAAGRWAAALLAVNEYHIGITCIATERASMFLFAALTLWMFLRFCRLGQTRWLYLTAICAAMTFWCNERAILLGLPIGATLIFTAHRKQFIRIHPYLALVLFLLIIAPIVKAHVQPAFAADHSALTANDNLSRIGGIGFTRQYVMFFLRQPIQMIYDHFGKELTDSAAGYATMNGLIGAFLLAATIFMTFRARRGPPALLFCALWFWFIFGVFVLIKPSENVTPGLDTVAWFWVDLILLPAVVMAAMWLIRFKDKAALAAVGLLAVVSTYGFITLPRSTPGMADSVVRCRPDLITPSDGQMVDVRAAFLHAMALPSDETVVLHQIIIETGSEKHVLTHVPGDPAPQHPDVDGAALGTDDREFRVRALVPRTDTGGIIPRSYKISYRLTSPTGDQRTLEAGIWPRAEDDPYWRWQPVFWVETP